MDAKGLSDAVQCVETMVDLVQGPCIANQEACLHAKLTNSVVSVLRRVHSCVSWVVCRLPLLPTRTHPCCLLPLGIVSSP